MSKYLNYFKKIKKNFLLSSNCNKFKILIFNYLEKYINKNIYILIISLEYYSIFLSLGIFQNLYFQNKQHKL